MNLFDPRCVRPTQLLLLAALSMSPLWTQAQPRPDDAAQPATGSPDPAAEAADAEAASPASALPGAVQGGAAAPDRANRSRRPPAEARFDIQVNTAEKELAEFLSRNLELQRYQRLRDLDDTELGRLLANAPANLRDLLGTLGYFEPVIDIVLTPPAPGATTHPLGTVKIQVDPGPETRIASSNVYFKGDIADAVAAAQQRETIRANSEKATGLAFTQPTWDRVKSGALRELTAQRYPRGRIANSLADIDTTTKSAHLHVELESGPPVQIGDIRVEGAERYDAVSIERMARLAGLTPGSDYDLEKLQAAQQRVADSGYYGSVFAYVDLDSGEATAPVVVQVRENLKQKLTLGVGGSTDNGPRLSAEHTNLRVPGLGWRAHSKLQYERNDQLLSTDWSAPLEADGWRWGIGARAARQVDDFTTTTSQRLTVGKSQETPDLDRTRFVQYDRAVAANTVLRLAEGEDAKEAISANVGWTRRSFDSVPYPNSGYGLGVTLGAGTTLGSVQRPFLRTELRWLGYLPLDAVERLAKSALAPTDNTATTGRAGRLALRVQGGAVTAADDAPLPRTLLFLAGGDNSVRGYGLRDIGVPQPDGGVAPGRYMAVGSLEWQRPIWRDGVRTPWESVVFVDAGAVADEATDLRAKVGVGAGVRYNSPVGPLQVDLAYGVDTKRVRLHLSVGFSF
ncbi:translocation and assembly module TamA [Hydrogenophaga palleronii]|uniref:Translocation and assembly module TamA n=1 Tax=Hydrogenophaga palleronii TaxID=65655 RepID=A0ABU1WLY9_9BURK|nr:BamA/TamA family outer membrane protein [Hydrogenophaga palleronii]MDR7150315.1 translocation and assembly module TamA [Hydrogenophaga palleronii]